ncbi:glycosyltransferase family 4 protein [Algibacter sp. TI.3.09]|uniref:glycosyltransferase family 4 protein n=1 Tax=Algibacter sp. TI.3.09 TaxID=3121298 RepID=UPI00311D5A49
MKKILFITNNFPPISDGVGDYTYNLAKTLLSKNVEIHIICSSKKEIKGKIGAYKNENINIYPVINKWDRSGCNQCLEQIEAINPNWISLQYVPHAFNKYGLPKDMIYLANNIRKKELNLHVFFHEVYTKINYRSYKSILLGIAMRYITKRIANAAKLLSTSNEGYQQLLGKVTNNTVSIIPVGSNINVNNSPLNAELKEQLKISSDTFIISTFGVKVRGLDSILKLAEEFKLKGIKFKFIFIGNLLKKEEIKSHIKKLGLEDHILITGFLNDNEVLDYLAISNLYLMLEALDDKNTWSGSSTRSGTLSTAFFMGLPIIGTKGFLSNYLLKHKQNIYLIDEYEQLKNATTEILNDKTLSTDLGKNAHRSYIENLSWNVIASEYAKILELEKY